MKLANEDVSMLAFTTEEITAPFLLPEMVITFPLSSMFYNLHDYCRLKFYCSFHGVYHAVLSERMIMFQFIFQVDRVASMLNYFLLQLVGPQRKSLSLKDPEKYEFRPKQLLKQVGISSLTVTMLLFLQVLVKWFKTLSLHV